MATKKHSKKASAKKAHKTMKKGSSSSVSSGVRGYCVKCKEMVDMVTANKIALKGAKSKSVCRYSGKDKHGHNVSAFVKC
jgi:hypothetical protein